VDFDPVAIHPAIPGVSFPAQNSSFAEALPREEADFDFSLVEPASKHPVSPGAPAAAQIGSD
jgi:hypothetical protein